MIVQWYSGVQELVLKRVSKTLTFRYHIDIPDPIRHAIILYVIKHDGCNKTELTNYMESKLQEKPPNYASTKTPIYASIKTTYKIVAELVRDKVMTQSVNVKNRREVQLHINPKNAMIYNELENIDNLIRTLTDLPPNLNKVRVEIILTMLRSLSYHVKSIKLPTYESDTFNREITKLNRKISEQVYNPQYTKEMFHSYKNKLIKLKLDPAVKNSPYNIKIIDELVKFAEEFNERFLN